MGTTHHDLASRKYKNDRAISLLPCILLRYNNILWSTEYSVFFFHRGSFTISKIIKMFENIGIVFFYIFNAIIEIKERLFFFKYFFLRIIIYVS